MLSATSPNPVPKSFGPAYSATTNPHTAIGTVTPTYDNNGNLIYDGFYNYTWDGEGNLATLNSNAETYDALDRRVEQYNGSAYTEIVYGPGGNKMALMSGQTVTKVFAPLSGGATAVYTASGLSYYRHPDWLGSSRVASTTSRTLYYDGAYAPFGENYAETGTTDRSFTGQNQDLASGLYDFPYREYHSIQGRWISPDRAGISVVDPTSPQSWDRYSYALNNPLRYVDPSGLDYCAPGSVWYDGDGNAVYDDSQCISDDQYGDGSAYPGYIYLSTTENIDVPDNGSSADLAAGSAFGILSWASNQVAGALGSTRAAIAEKIKGVICGLYSPLLGASQMTGRTVGTGVGASAGAGFILGVAGTVSEQMVADPQGNVGFAISFGGNPGYGVFGGGALIGTQAMASNAPTIGGLGGFSLGAGGTAGPLGLDVTVSTGGAVTLTGTGGIGAGLDGAALSLNYTFVPSQLSVNCKE
ncbi:MAG TPA: RHS repeat-associated core domain-containing protein [Bryobacteraceae bacterium]|nr:RHS repeat-associated core domain-containing protein [Bryobacteraceae bacterium]